MPSRLATCLLVALSILLGQAGRASARAPRSPMTVVSVKDMSDGEAQAAVAATPGRSRPSASPTPGGKKSVQKSASPTPSVQKSASPTQSTRKSARPAPPAVELVALNSHESFSLRPAPSGGFGRPTMRALARFLRCHHTQRLHAISERLAELLYATASHFHSRLEIIAGYRAPKVARKKGNTKSPHKRGVACDFRVPGITNELLRDFVRGFPRVGVGFYPNSGFVHLDVRDKQSAFWVDYSAPGERAVYSKTPEVDVRKLAEKADIDTEGPDPQMGEEPGGVTPSLPTLMPANPQED